MCELSNEKLTFKDYRDLVIQSGMQAIPYVGGSLSTLYFGFKQEKRFKRLESFYLELNEEIESVKEKIPDIANQNPEELGAIIEELHDKIEAEHLSIKRDLYKQYYKQTLLYPVNGNYDERKLYLDILSQLMPLNIRLIIFLSMQSGPVAASNIVSKGTEKAVILGAISQLKNYGIIEGKLNNIVFSGIGDNAINEDVSLTELGRKFHHFCLNEPIKF